MGSALQASVMVTTWSTVFLLVSLVSVQCKDDENDRETANNLLGQLTTASVLDKKVSFRCGAFFPNPKNPAALPVSPFIIFNTSWPAEECSTTGPDYDRYNSFCANIMNQFTGLLSLEGPSLKKDRRAEGFSIGDDICQFLKVNVKAPFVGKRSKKFPEGLNIGMFSNACGDKTWTNSENDYGDRICCR